jgi:hypothetical protein
VLNGLVLFTAGILNIVNIITIVSLGANVFWGEFGFFQIGWGVRELTKFSKYRSTKKKIAKAKKG